MKILNISTISLMALVTSCFIQIGAQLFAITIIASTLAEAPPRSFAMLQGEYGYNSTAFWDIVPAITFVLFIIALIFNWKTKRRKYILLALTLFVIAGLLAGIYLEPIFAEMSAEGYSDEVNLLLKNKAAKWYAADWMVWVVGSMSGILLLLALVIPNNSLKNTPNASS